VTGCRVRCPHPVTAHGKVWVLLPAGLGGRLPLPVRGEVARAESVRGEPTGVCDLALRFRSPSPRAYDRLCAIVQEALAPSVEAAGSEERRSAPRRWFGRRVIARGAGRPRVLLGRDLSVSGMRAENAEGVRVGDPLQLALHAQPGGVPLVVTARVVRVDASGAAALHFEGLGEGTQSALQKLVWELGESGGATLVSEVLEPSPRLESQRD